MQPSRRNFLATMGIGTLSLGWASNLDSSHQRLTVPNTMTGDLPLGFPAQDAESVKEIVSAAHSRLEDVKTLVTARPALARASWDWGFGDWESALGAACHMGRRDIASVLIEHGARPDLFTHVLMGHIDAVKSIVGSTPGIQSIRGPHGITLMRHAIIAANNDSLTPNEKQTMKEIIAFLETEGNADKTQTDLGISENEAEAYTGVYRFGENERDYFSVELSRRGKLYMSRAEDIGRSLGRVEEHTFAPYGAEAVRIRFTMENEMAKTLTIHDPQPLVTATRA